MVECHACKNENTHTCNFCNKVCCFEHMPNNTGGWWAGGHTCLDHAPKCEVTTSVVSGCGGQIRKCKQCEFYFCWTHRKPGYKNGHYCSIGCDSTIGSFCMGTRQQLKECELCTDKDGKSYKYCAYHFTPVNTLLSLGAKKEDEKAALLPLGAKQAGEEAGQGGHVCNGFTEGSVLFGDKAEDYAGLIIDSLAAIITENPGHIAAKFAVRSLRATISQMKYEFNIEPEEFEKAANSVKNIVQLVVASTTTLIEKEGLNEPIQTSLGKLQGMDFSKILSIPTSGDKGDNLAGIKLIKNIASGIISQLQSMVDEILDLQQKLLSEEDKAKALATLQAKFTELTNMMDAFLKQSDGDINNVKVIVDKIDTALGLGGKLSEIIPSVQKMPDRFGALLLSKNPNFDEPVKTFIAKVTTEISIVSEIDFHQGMTDDEKFAQVVKTATQYVQTFFRAIDKVAKIIETYTQMVQFIANVKEELDKSSPNYVTLIKMGSECVEFTKSLFTLSGYYDSPRDLGGTCWELTKEEDTEEAKLKSIDIGRSGSIIVDPRNGSAIDGKMQDLLMDLLYERRENMQKLERTIGMMQRTISRLEAQQQPQQQQNYVMGRSSARRTVKRTGDRNRSNNRMNGQSVASRNGIDPNQAYFV